LKIQITHTHPLASECAIVKPYPLFYCVLSAIVLHFTNVSLLNSVEYRSQAHSRANYTAVIEPVNPVTVFRNIYYKK